jgi:hypothetical protein
VDDQQAWDAQEVLKRMAEVTKWSGVVTTLEDELAGLTIRRKAINQQLQTAKCRMAEAIRLAERAAQRISPPGQP